jgi:hypothetical protein
MARVREIIAINSKLRGIKAFIILPPSYFTGKVLPIGLQGLVVGTAVGVGIGVGVTMSWGMTRGLAYSRATQPRINSVLTRAQSP